jgi:hypothetical protein
VIVILILLVVIIFMIVKNYLNLIFLSKQFDKHNMIVFGKKGSGKDLFFQTIIKYRKKRYYSNIPYGYKREQSIAISDLSVSPNTFEQTIDNKFHRIPVRFEEKIDFYVSDGGIYLPSQYDSLIDRKFPSLFIFYVLIRHLYNSNIHINYNGSITRLYKKLREQADGYVKMRGVIKLPFILVLLGTYYDKFESAESSLLPLSSRAFNGFSKAETDLYRAQNGVIKDFFVFVRKKSIKYDTRYFKNVILDSESHVSDSGAIPTDNP